MKKIIFLITLVTTLLLSANFAFADQESIESNNEEVKVISLEDIKGKAGNYDLIVNQSTKQYKQKTQDTGTFHSSSLIALSTMVFPIPNILLN